MEKDDLIHAIARKHKISFSKAKEAIDSQFKCVKYVMEKGEGDSIRLQYFGKFSVNKKQYEVLKKKTNKGLQKKNE